MTDTTAPPKNPPTRLEKLAEAPAQACCLRSVGSLQFAAEATDEASGQKGDYDKPRAVELLARSFGPADHPWWFGGKVYHDFDGMRMHKPRLMVDYNHADPIGYCEKPNVAKDEGLKLGGAIVPAGGEDDWARVVLKRGDAGVPYEASIDFYGPMSVEYVDDGLSAEVNGETVDGPCSIVRDWTLRGVAVCPYGADMHAETQFAGRGAVRLRVVSPEEDGSNVVTSGGEPARMSTPTEGGNAATDETPADDQANTDSGSSAAGETGGESNDSSDAGSSSAGEDSAQAEFSKKLDKYTNRFGAVKGVELFKAGTDYVEALEQSHTELGKQLAVANQKLSGLNAAEAEGLGEGETGGKFGTADDNGKAKGFANRLNVPG